MKTKKQKVLTAYELQREHEKVLHSLITDNNKQYFQETIRKYNKIQFLGFMEFALNHFQALSSLSSDRPCLNEMNLNYLKSLYKEIDLALQKREINNG